MTILLTGANGYIGMRLLPELLKSGHTVLCCVRSKSRFPIDPSNHPNLRVFEADFLKSESLKDLPLEFDTAYYLIHSLSDQVGNFSERESAQARNFVAYLNTTTARRIIYVGGIANHTELSEHLQSRQSVEAVLAASQASLTTLRAGIIVGSGSASFEIMRDLVEKLPVMIAPKWLNTLCQPIAIRDVIALLTKVIELEATAGKTYDIGGPDVLSYKQMLLIFAKVRELRRNIITLPFLSPRLSSLWLYFVTSTSIPLARNLVDSMKTDVVARQNDLMALAGIQPISYQEAVQLAFQKMSQNMVPSSWKDALSSSGSPLMNPEDYVHVPVYGCFKDVKERELSRPPEEVLRNIWSIGGERGWYYATWLWKLRGYMDKAAGGIGLRRGRRSKVEIYPGDALDFWRVLVSSWEQRRLLLYAEMKLPGEAWLEFKIIPRDGKYIFVQTATFRPKGLWGRLYWYLVVPFHLFVFSGMASRITRYEEGSHLVKTT